MISQTVAMKQLENNYSWELSECVEYYEGYKYQYASDYVFEIPEGFPTNVEFKSEYIEIKGDRVKVKRGYASDGPSGPTIDTPSFMRGAFEHDPMYQLLRMGVYPPECRIFADRGIIARAKKSGMWFPRRWWTYAGLRYFGANAASPSSVKKILRAY